MRFSLISEEDKAIYLMNKPIRLCRLLHECCICNKDIKLKQCYYDGGYGKRAHLKCVKENID